MSPNMRNYDRMLRILTGTKHSTNETKIPSECKYFFKIIKYENIEITVLKDLL